MSYDEENNLGEHDFRINDDDELLETPEEEGKNDFGLDEEEDPDNRYT